MTREMYRDARASDSKSIDNHIIGNIIEEYKEDNDNDSYYNDSLDVTKERRVAEDGELIHGSRVTKKDDGWYLDFYDNGKKLDGPYQEIQYDAEYLYCQIIFDLVYYRYELTGLLADDSSQYGYFAYLKKFIDEHKDDYNKFKKAKQEFEADKYLRRKRAVLFELDYRHQRRAHYDALHGTNNQEYLGYSI